MQVNGLESLDCYSWLVSLYRRSKSNLCIHVFNSEWSLLAGQGQIDTLVQVVAIFIFAVHIGIAAMLLTTE